MESTLTNLCINTIAEQIYRAPPMIQEMIIEQSTDIIEQKVKDEVKQELMNELKILKEIVPSISKNIIINRSSFFNNDPNYYKIYHDIPKHIVKLAVEIADHNVTELNNSFNLLTFVSSRRYNFYSTENEQETSSEEIEEQYETENSSETE